MKNTPAKIKRPLWVVGLNLALALTVGSTQAFADTQITNQTQLEAIVNDPAGSYVVTQSFSVIAPIAGGNSSYVNGTFTGTFDGAGFSISGLTKPLFDAIGGDGINAEVANLTLIADEDGVSGRGLLANDTYSGTIIENVHGIGDVEIAENSVGGLVGYLGTGEIRESTFTGDVSGLSNVGGLVGVSYGEISDSSYSGNVTGVGSVGGLVGDLNQHITNSSAQGTVSGESYVGGLVGNSLNGTIYDSYATGDVTGDEYIGGLVGYSTDSTITNSYATGDVTGNVDIGGLVGNSSNVTIDNSYATGDVTGNGDVGGLVGHLFGTIDNSYAAGAVEGTNDVGGLVGDSSGDITNSYATGDVTGEGEYIGGLVGDSFGTITNSYATGNVTGTGASEVYEGVGGLVGYLGGTLNNTYATGIVMGIDYVGGLVGETGGYAAIYNSHAAGNVSGITAVGGLVGFSDVVITNSYATGDVTGDGGTGGLVGYSDGDITNSYATGNVDGVNDVGGLVGHLFGTIDNSYATGNVGGFDGVGGLVGYSDGTITNSYATGDVTSSLDEEGYAGGDAGGLVGFSDGAITNSYATGDVIGGEYDVGGLVGDLTQSGSITNSYATGDVIGSGDSGRIGGLVGESGGTITNSYATGNVGGFEEVGGLVGYSYSEGTITNSYATGDVTSSLDEEGYAGGLVGFSDGAITNSYGTGSVNGTPYDADEPTPYILEIINTVVGELSPAFLVEASINYGLPYLISLNAPNTLTILNTPFGDDFVPAFGENASINGGRPFLISLIDSYDVAVTPSYSLRSYYTQAAKSLDKALAHFGFKSNFSSHPNLGFKALEQNQSKLPPVIQLFEVSEYQNSRILLNKEDGLQLSISSYYKEAVEIWTQGLNGEYLYLGLIEFDKDGQAILPTLKFDTANTYQLLMIKAVDKLSEKPNLQAQLGQININVF